METMHFRPNREDLERFQRIHKHLTDTGRRFPTRSDVIRYALTNTVERMGGESR